MRFIAANDNLDTANAFDIMSIFRDAINEWYVADTRRKIKIVFKLRMEKGLRCSGYRQLTRDGTMHYMFTAKMEAAILAVIQRVSRYVRHKELDRLVKRYTDFSELTTPMLNEFIKKMVVHEGEGWGKDRCQWIDIYLNVIGAFETPDYIITPAEVVEQCRQQEERESEEKRPATYCRKKQPFPISAYINMIKIKCFLKYSYTVKNTQ